MASNHGRILLGMLVVQDLAVVVLIVVLPQLANRADLVVADLLLTLVKVGLFIGVTLFLGARVVPRVMRLVERLGSPELFLLAAVILAIGTATVSALIGLSFALGAFMAGLLLTETELDHRVVAEVVPMRNLFATIFFVSVGMLIDPLFILNNLPAVLGMALFIIVAKALLTMLALLPFRLGSKTLVFTSLGMIQIGEFSYLLAETGHTVGAISDRLLSLVLTSSLVTILATPAAFWIAPRVDLALARLPGLGRLFGAHVEILGNEAAFAGHALVIGYGRVGRRVTAGLRAAGLTVVVLEQDLHLIQELSAAGIPSVYGDASYQTIMEAAHADRARLIVVALPDAGGTRAVVLNARRANPTVPILARVASNEHDEEIVTAGASSIVAP
jgi:CPA2 family monovalent cation:H+ antiporter-2